MGVAEIHLIFDSLVKLRFDPKQFEQEKGSYGKTKQHVCINFTPEMELHMM